LAQAAITRSMKSDRAHNRPFVERIFTIEGDDAPCRFLAPLADGEDFRCDYEIFLPNGYVRRFHGMGVDAVQVLLLAMQNAHAELLTYREHNKAAVSWLGNRRQGLPVAETLRDLDGAD